MNVVITGASSGIGLGLCQYYLQNGHKVFALVRKASKALLTSKSDNLTIIENVDITDSALESALQSLNKVDVNLLINNAGQWADDQLGAVNNEDMIRQFQVNALGALQVTQGLLNNFVRGSKVINITSRMGSIADNDSGGRYGYRASKAALNAIGKSLAIDLAPKGVFVAQLHPGFVKTKMVGFNGLITVDESVAGLVELIDKLNADNSGCFYHQNGELLPW